MSKNIVEPDDTLHAFVAEILRRNEIIGISMAGAVVHLDVAFVRVAMRICCAGPMSSTSLAVGCSPGLPGSVVHEHTGCIDIDAANENRGRISSVLRSGMNLFQR